MRSLYTSENGDKFVGTCKHIDSLNMCGAYTCKNQCYVLIKNQYKHELGLFYKRRVISIGYVFREYGRSITIPTERYKLDEDIRQ